MPTNRSIHLPDQYAIDTKVAGNKIRQISRPEFLGELPTHGVVIGRSNCLVATRRDGTQVLIARRRPNAAKFDGDVLVMKDLEAHAAVDALDARTGKWIQTEPSAKPALTSGAAAAVTASWEGKFAYRTEAPGKNGLRPPQMGALFATIAHWIANPEIPATVVMPTGTGKTETMLAVLMERCIPRLLVVVPNSALREQITRKFLCLGILKECGVLDPGCPYPIVGTMEHHFPTAELAEEFVSSCNVIVTTIQAINTCSEDIRRVISGLCSHLVIDEAHHVSAPSWENFRSRFHGKHILQFTATPFRTDGKLVSGKMIFTYPLKKAQEEGYFQAINFRPVFAYIDPDDAIAEAAIAQLAADLDASFDHIVMARVDNIERAGQVHAIYQRLGPEYNPLVIHSKLSSASRADALDQLRGRRTRVVVCVDMLGEGFDLPELKIAALHDVHKSLAITLQFTGRFTRVKRGGKVGEATIVANRASADVQQRLRALYAEDADWNRVIRDLSHEATGGAEDSSEFAQSFPTLPREVPLQNLAPKMSTVAYKTSCELWDPGGIYRVFSEDALYTKEVAVSERHRIAWFVTVERTPVGWGELRGIEDVVYSLFVLHWDQEQNLLFVNSSANGSVFEELAKQVGGEAAELIRGPEIYRALHGINRMVPTNLGLLDFVSRARRFTMHVGADVADGLAPSQTNTKTKTNLFGFGFENGERASIGCSLKGRIWSYLVANDLASWAAWCRGVGRKLLDESITSEDVFRGFIRPVRVVSRPPLVPLAIEWPLEFLAAQEDRVSVAVGTDEAMFFDADLRILEHRREGPIRFRVTAARSAADYEIVFSAEGTSYRALGTEAIVTLGKRTFPLSQWLNKAGPKIHFEKDTFIERDLLLPIERDIRPIAVDGIDTWDWSGTDITKESQKAEKRPDSIQRKVLDHLLSESEWDLVFDDDDSGEMADVVAVKMAPDRLIVHLFHCKYSSEKAPGARVDDLYDVCGQAQKSIRWRERSGLSTLVPHLVSRERSRLDKGLPSRFERGSFRTLEEIGSRQSALTPDFKVWIVQPGVSKNRASDSMLELLEATRLFLHETFAIQLGIVTSA